MTDLLKEKLTRVMSSFSVDPEVRAILEKAKKGEVSETDALKQMYAYVQDHPELITALQGLNVGTLQNLHPPEGVMRTEKDRLPRLNPLFEAALIERAQFDGDIPEHRTGPKPKGAPPAVPVITKARNPVAVGKMLETASTRVGKELREHEAERYRAIEAIEAGDDVLKLMGKHGQLVRKEDIGNRDLMKHGSAETDLPTYRRGQVPAPIRTRRPPASVLARMGDKDARQLAYKTFSTTQGRRSVLPTIRGLVADSLRDEGWDVREREYHGGATEETVLAFHSWSVSISGAPGTQAAFAFVDTAAKALTRNLLDQLADKEKNPLVLEINTVDVLDERTVGWAGRLLC